jgi:hypothetical protein
VYNVETEEVTAGVAVYNVETEEVTAGVAVYNVETKETLGLKLHSVD